MAVFSNLSSSRLHPWLPLGLPIPPDYLSEKEAQMYGTRSGWSGELFSMSIVLLGCAWTWRNDEATANQIAKWWGRAFMAQMLRFWITPFFHPHCIWQTFWLVFFWPAFGGGWVWSELLPVTAPKQKP